MTKFHLQFHARSRHPHQARQAVLSISKRFGCVFHHAMAPQWNPRVQIQAHRRVLQNASRPATGSGIVRDELRGGRNGDVDSMNHAPTRRCGAHTDNHLLTHESSPARITWRAFGLTQQAARRDLSHAAHRTENGGQCGHAGLGGSSTSVHKRVGTQGLQQRPRGPRPCRRSSNTYGSKARATVTGIGLDKTELYRAARPNRHMQSAIK